MYNHFLKRIIDLVFAVIVIVIISPILLLTAVLIPLESNGPIFFRQKRVGKGFKEIEVLKFRSMTNEKREVGNKPILGKAAGVTNVGYVIRRLKIDELPQLLNVIKGDLSLVGPRPSVRSQLDAMNEKQKLRYSIRPGLTGLAQVSGNIHLSWPERYSFDLAYIKNRSFILDLRILVRTFFLIIKGEEYFKDKPLIQISED